MTNGRSKCYNTLEIIALMKEKEILDAFINDHKKSFKYILLTKKIQARLESGENMDNEHEEIYLNEWIRKEKWTGSLSDYLKELYPKLVAYIAEWHKKQKTSEWQREVEQLCWEVEAFCDLEEYEQAAVWLKSNEEKIHKKYGNKILENSGIASIYIEKLVVLKYYLEELISSVSMNQSEEGHIYYQFFRIFSPIWRKWRTLNKTQVSQKHGNEKNINNRRLFYHLLDLYTNQTNQIENLDHKLKVIEQKISLPETSDNAKSNNENNSAISQALYFRTYLLLLRKLYLAYEIDDKSRQRRAIEAISQNFSGSIINDANLKVVLNINHFERMFATKEFSIDFAKQFFEKIENNTILNTEPELENVLARFELNKIYLLFSSKKYDIIWTTYFHCDANIARKAIYKSVNMALKVLRILTFFELRLEYKFLDNSALDDILRSEKKNKEIEDFNTLLKTTQRNLRDAIKHNPDFELAKEIICKIPDKNLIDKKEFTEILKSQELKKLRKNIPLDRLLMDWVSDY